MGQYIVQDPDGSQYIVDDGKGDSSGQSSSQGGFSLTTPQGPDYSQSIGRNALRGIEDSPAAAVQLATDINNLPASAQQFGDDAQNSITDGLTPEREARLEKDMKTVGGLGAGIAGAGAGGELGALAGTALLPGVGTAALGLLGGAAGFGAGLLGFNFTADKATGDQVPASNYIKDLAYNVPQALTMGTVGDLAARGAAGATHAVVDPLTDSGAGDRVAATLQQIEPGYADKVDTALSQNGGDPFIDYKSLGELIDSDTLKNLQRTTARDGSTLADVPGSPYASQRAADMARNDAQLKYLNEIENSPANAADVQQSIQSGQDAAAEASQRGLSTAQGSVNDAVAALPTPIDTAEAGADLRGNISAGKDAIKAAVNQKFESIGTGQVNTAPVLEAANKLMPKYFKDVGPQANSELVNLVSGLTKEAEPTGILDAKGNPITHTPIHTMKDVQALRSQALDIANGSDARTAAVASQLAQSLKEAGDAAVKSGTVTPIEAKAWDDAIALRKQQGVTYESSATPAKGILAKQPYGEFKLADPSVPGKIFTAGEKGGVNIKNYKDAVNGSNPLSPDEQNTLNQAQRLMRTHQSELAKLQGPEGDAPVLSDTGQSTGYTERSLREAHIARLQPQIDALESRKSLDPNLDSINRYAADKFRSFAQKGDLSIDSTKANRFLRDHASALNELPDLKQQLSDVHTRQQFLNEKFGEIKRSQADVQKGAVSYFLKGDPERAVGAMLSGKDMVKRTVATVEYLKRSDPEALAGLRRAVKDHLEAKTFVPDGSAPGGGVPLEEARLRGGQQFDGTTRGAVFKNEWERIRPALEKSGLFTDSQMKSFDTLYRDKVSQLSVEKSKMAGGSDTAQNTSVMDALSNIAANKFIDHASFGLSRILKPILSGISNAKFKATLAEALLDPRMARDLQTKATAKNLTRAAHALFGDVISTAVGGTSTAVRQGQDQKPAPHKVPIVPKQRAVTSKKSFPAPSELLSPPAPGKPSVNKLDMNSFLKGMPNNSWAQLNVDPATAARLTAQPPQQERRQPPRRREQTLPINLIAQKYGS